MERALREDASGCLGCISASFKGCGPNLRSRRVTHACASLSLTSFGEGSALLSGCDRQSYFKWHNGISSWQRPGSGHSGEPVN